MKDARVAGRFFGALFGSLALVVWFIRREWRVFCHGWFWENQH